MNVNSRLFSVFLLGSCGNLLTACGDRGVCDFILGGCFDLTINGQGAYDGFNVSIIDENSGLRRTGTARMGPIFELPTAIRLPPLEAQSTSEFSRIEVRTIGSAPMLFGSNQISWPSGEHARSTVDLMQGICAENWCLQNQPPAGPKATSMRLTSVWGSDARNVWATSVGGILLHYNGSHWSSVNIGVSPDVALLSIFGSSANSIWVVGYSGSIKYWDGANWEFQNSATTEPLRGGWGVDNTDAWIVGKSGTILHFQNNVWTAVAESGKVTSESLAAIRGRNKNDIWAVGDKGTILHYDGNAWTHSAQSGQLTANDLYCIWVDGGGKGWSSGVGTTFLQLSGGQWSATTQPVGIVGFAGLWGSASTSVWGVGYQGRIAVYEGAAWRTVIEPGVLGATELTAIWGTGPNDIWAVGDGGRILKLGP